MLFRSNLPVEDDDIIVYLREVFGDLNTNQEQLMLQAWKENIAPIQVVNPNDLRDEAGNYRVQANDTPLDPQIRYVKWIRDSATLLEELGQSFLNGGGTVEKYQEIFLICHVECS